MKHQNAETKATSKKQQSLIEIDSQKHQKRHDPDASLNGGRSLSKSMDTE